MISSGRSFTKISLPVFSSWRRVSTQRDIMSIIHNFIISFPGIMSQKSKLYYLDFNMARNMENIGSNLLAPMHLNLYIYFSLFHPVRHDQILKNWHTVPYSNSDQTTILSSINSFRIIPIRQTLLGSKICYWLYVCYEYTKMSVKK